MIRRRNVLLSLTGLAAAFVVLLSAVAPVFAADTNTASGNGMKVGPLHNDLTVQPGSTGSFDLQITNITAQTTTYEIVVNDFVAKDETGSPYLILNPGESAPSHSLRKFLQDFSDITLKPGEQKTIKIAISIPANATPGGYFGAIRFTATNSQQSAKNVSLAASVAPLVLVKVPGNYKEQMGIESLDTRNSKGKIHSVFTKNSDINAVVRFKNTGDIQEAPFGKVTVTKMGGKVVYSTEINGGEEPGSVLPDSIRKFSVPLKNIGSFGKYSVQGDFGYGKGQTLAASTTFYVIPLPVMILLLVLVVLLIVLIVETPRLLKRYNRRVLRRAGRK